MIALCAAGASLPGCNRLDVNSPGIRGIAYVRLDAVMAHDPLYPQLSHIDDAIAMVTLEAAGPRVPRSAAEIAREDARLRAEMAAAQQRTQRIVTQKQQEYAAHARTAIAKALAAAGVSGANVAAAMGQVSAQQVQAAQVQAGRDYMAYQQSVVQQGNSAAGSLVRQLQSEGYQKLQAKASQEQQAETDLSLRLSQQDAAKRLSIQTRLSMLALDDATRRQLQAQLNAITQREAAAISVQRAADQRAFAAYRAQVTAQTNAAIRAQLSQIQSETQAKLVGRRNAVGAQLRSLAPSPNASISPATQAQIRAIAQQFQQQYQNDVQNVLATYAETRDALIVQDALLHGADAAANSASAQETQILQQQRQALYEQIFSRIQREAERLAKDRGFSVVFSNVTAAAGGYDMTNDLIHDIESEHE
ncbi:MAG TPA: hypothetical protein VIN40_05025 [Candidatus Tyrphobacter sp.]